MSSRDVGNAGELLAETFLKAKGWQILDRNPHFRFSEIDILADNGESIVIVEVKAKKSYSHGAAVEMITPAKKARLARLAEMLSVAYNKPIRVDVITIDNFGSSHPQLVHYENALE